MAQVSKSSVTLPGPPTRRESSDLGEDGSVAGNARNSAVLLIRRRPGDKGPCAHSVQIYESSAILRQITHDPLIGVEDRPFFLVAKAPAMMP